MEVAGDGQLIGTHGGLQVAVFGGQHAVHQDHVRPLAGQEGGGGLVGDERAGHVVLAQLLGQQGPGGQRGAALAEGDLLNELPLPAPAGDAQGPGGGGGVERTPVGPQQDAGALAHEVGAVAGGVAVGHDLLPLKRHGGGQEGRDAVYVSGVGFGRIRHEVQGQLHVPAMVPALQQHGAGPGQDLVKLRGLLQVLGSQGGLTQAIGPGDGGDLFLQDRTGGEDLDRLFQAGAGEPPLLLGIHRLVQQRQDAVLPQK